MSATLIPANAIGAVNQALVQILADKGIQTGYIGGFDFATAFNTAAAGEGGGTLVGNLTASAGVGEVITGNVANSGTNVGTIVNNSVALTGSTLLLSLRNNNVEKFNVDNAGVVTAAGIHAPAASGLTLTTFNVTTTPGTPWFTVANSVGLGLFGHPISINNQGTEIAYFAIDFANASAINLHFNSSGGGTFAVGSSAGDQYGNPGGTSSQSIVWQGAASNSAVIHSIAGVYQHQTIAGWLDLSVGGAIGTKIMMLAADAGAAATSGTANAPCGTFTVSSGQAVYTLANTSILTTSKVKAWIQQAAADATAFCVANVAVTNHQGVFTLNAVCAANCIVAFEVIN